VIGRHGDVDVNDNRRLLLQLCCNNTLCLMKTFFQHRNMHNYTWCRDSLGQLSLIDYCMVSADLFRSVLDVCVKRGTERSTDHHLLVCNMHLEKPLGPTQTCRIRKSYRIKWEALVDKYVRKTFADSISSLFRELSECTVDSEVERQL